MKNYLKESLLSLLCFIIHGQGSSEKGLKILNCETEIYLIAVVSCLHARNWNRKGFLPLISNILFVSIHFTLEKVFVTFFVQMNAPK